MKNLLYALSEGIGICLVAGALISGCNYARKRFSLYSSVKRINELSEQVDNVRTKEEQLRISAELRSEREKISETGLFKGINYYEVK